MYIPLVFIHLGGEYSPYRFTVLIKGDTDTSAGLIWTEGDAATHGPPILVYVNRCPTVFILELVEAVVGEGDASVNQTGPLEHDPPSPLLYFRSVIRPLQKYHSGAVVETPSLTGTLLETHMAGTDPRRALLTKSY